MSASFADKTTDRTTSHLTNPAKDAEQVIGYSHSTKPASGQVAGYARLLAVPARHGGAQPSQCGSAEQQACPPQVLRIAVSGLPSRKNDLGKISAYFAEMSGTLAC
jgi:hypothetical protein